MKLFDDFEAIKFPEENLIFITNAGHIYYIYYPEQKFWKKYEHAGNVHITVENYPDVSKEELSETLGGKFPQKETDFMRFCNPSGLWVRDLMDLLEEDYSTYMEDCDIYHSIRRLLCISDISYKSYLKLKELLDITISMELENEQVLIQIKELCFTIMGRDIFKEEIYICDGHDGESCFWINPVRIIDFSDTNNDWDNVAEMTSVEISIEEDDVNKYLTPFLYKYFDDELEANKKRVQSCWTNDDGTEECLYVEGFEWYLTHNFYTYNSIISMLKDIKDTINALSSGRENEFTAKIKKDSDSAAYKLFYMQDMSDEQIKEHNNTEIELIIDFYRRFIYRMEYMMTVGKEKGYNLISFMGP